MDLVSLDQSAISLPSLYNDAFDSADTHASVQRFRESLHAILEPSEIFEACIGMRNRLLDCYSSHQQHLELLFETIDTVMQEECPQYSEQKLLWSTSHDTHDEDVQRWKRFIDVVEKGRGLRKQCFAPLNKTGNTWGDDKVRHYGWALTSYKFCKLLGQVAARKSWKEAVTKLNQLIARRITKGRVKDSANPIEQVDLLDLLAWDGAFTFTKTGTKGQELYAVENANINLIDLPRGYGLDRFGLIVRHEYVDSTSYDITPSSLPVSMPSLGPHTNPSEVSDITALPELPRQCTSPLGATVVLQPSNSLHVLAEGSVTTESARTSHVVEPAVFDVTLQSEKVEHDLRRSARSHVKPLSSYQESIPRSKRTHARKPRLDETPSDRTCSCLRLVAAELLHAIERDCYLAGDAEIFDKHSAQQEFLCTKHIKQYAKWSTSGLVFHRRLALLKPVTSAHGSFPSHQDSLPRSSQKRRLSLPELDLTRFKRQTKLPLPAEASPFIETPAILPFQEVAQDATFLQAVLTELRGRSPRPETWDERNVESMVRLLGRAAQPVTTGSDNTIEAYFLSGSDAEAHLLPEISLHGPIITTQQQSFQWSEGGSRPIKQLFDRMWNFNREISVQDPSHTIDENSCKQMTLYDVRRAFLIDSGSRRLNVLEMRNPIPRSTLPRFLTGEDCQLLSQIRDVVLDSTTAQRISTTAKKWREWKDDEEWLLLAQGGALTLPHQDSCGKSTWLTVQEGLVGFGWVSRPTEQERSEWSEDPVNFRSGRIRYVVLRPGQTIYFEMGTIHFVFRLQDTQTLMFGGHILRWSRISQWMNLLQKQLSSPDTSNEDLPPRLVRTYVNAVEKLVNDQAERRKESSLAKTFLTLRTILYTHSKLAY